MASPTNKIEQTATILKNVDVSEMFASLAIGIAEAQEKLDDNSIKQLVKLAEKEVAGKSLLELGFQPAFYAFEYADISAAINLKFATKEEFEIDFNVEGEYTKNTNFDREFFKNQQKSSSKSLSKHASKSFQKSLKAKHSASFQIDNQERNVHKEKGSFNMIERAKEDISNTKEGIRCESYVDSEKKVENLTSQGVKIYTENGLIVISLPKETAKQAIVKMKNDYATDVDIALNNSSLKFTKKTDFDTSYANAKGLADIDAIGITSDKMTDSSGTVEMTYYFKFAGDTLDDDYCQGVKGATCLQKEHLKILALLLKHIPGLNITITGHTDGSGSDSYNQELSERRSQAIKNFIVNNIDDTNFDKSRISTEGKGESEATDEQPNPLFRKATIRLPAGFDFIYLESGTVDFDPDNSGDDQIYLINPVTIPSNITFRYGSQEANFTHSSLTSITDSFQLNQGFYIEKHSEDLYYMLDKEAYVNYFIFSLEDKNLDILVNGQRQKEIDKENTYVYTKEVDKSKDRLKQLTRNSDGDKTFAMSGALDVRYARQFSMSLDGNASIQARIVSLPMPTGLELHIASVYGIPIDNSDTEENAD
ncbi:MAG: OmpA family protein [Bacteroidota bacterium]